MVMKFHLVIRHESYVPHARVIAFKPCCNGVCGIYKRPSMCLKDFDDIQFYQDKWNGNTGLLSQMNSSEVDLHQTITRRSGHFSRHASRRSFLWNALCCHERNGP
jgi:hypothetical protein